MEAEVIQLKKKDYRHLYSKIADIMKMDFDFHTGPYVEDKGATAWVSGKIKHTIPNTGVDVSIDE